MCAPDDWALAHRRLITATRGELGSDDPRCDPASLAMLREKELRSAMRVIGVSDVRFLGLADGDCELADRAMMTSIVADAIGEVRPDVVVTFGPDGITGHPDHQAVARWTIGAWRRCPSTELLLATMTDEFVRRNAALHDRIGLSMGLPLRSIPEHDLALHVGPSADERRRKWHVLAAHASQTTSLVDLMGRLVVGRALSPCGSSCNISSGYQLSGRSEAENEASYRKPSTRCFTSG